MSNLVLFSINAGIYICFGITALVGIHAGANHEPRTTKPYGPADVWMGLVILIGSLILAVLNFRAAIR